MTDGRRKDWVAVGRDELSTTRMVLLFQATKATVVVALIKVVVESQERSSNLFALLLPPFSK